NLVLFLKLLKQVPDYHQPDLKEQLINNVKNFLLLGSNDLPFRRQLLAYIKEALRTCADRALLYYNDICNVALLHQVKDPLEKLRLVIGLERKRLLKGLVEEHIKTKVAVDPLELQLYAETKLYAELDF